MPEQVVVRRMIAGVGMVRLGYNSHPKAILHLQLYSQSVNSTKGWGKLLCELQMTSTPCLPRPRTALLLRTEMSILRDDKMRPLFQEVIVTKLAVTQSTTRYQMNAMDIIFPMIPHESI